MSGARPPRWLESLVERRLAGDAHGASTLGDLSEGYAHRSREGGRLRARVWYARQALSLVVRGSAPARVQPAAGWWDRTVFELRSALRRIRRRPAATLAVSGVLAAAVAAAAAAFSVTAGTHAAAHWWADEARAVVIWPEYPFSRGQMDMLRTESRSFESIGGVLRRPAVLALGDREASARAVELSPELFVALRARPVLGRGLAAEDARPGAEPVVVVSAALWRTAFGEDRAVIGRVFEINGVRRRVVGVMPAGASQPGPGTELWLPLVLDPSDPDFWPARELTVAGITRPGVSLTEARDDVRAALGVQARRFAFFYRPDFGADATVLRSAERSWGAVATPLLLLLLGTGLLLAVAAIDVGNLVLARSIDRRPELRVRLAIGASRGQVVRQILIEAGVQVVLAVLVGAWLGALLARQVPGLFPFGTPVTALTPADPRMLFFLGAVALGAWALTAGIPAAHFLATSRRAMVSRFRRDAAPRGLVVAQAALSTMLLVAASLLFRTVQQLDRLPLGFDATQTVAVPVAPAAAATTVSEPALRSAVAERLAADPAIELAGWISAVPLLDPLLRAPVNREDAQRTVSEAPTAARFVVDAGALEALGIVAVRGRGFAAGDDAFGPPVVLVSETMSRAIWPDADPVGRRIAVDPHSWNAWITVVGVVPDLRFEDLTLPPQPAFFLPRAQAWSPSMTLVARTTGGPAALAAPVRAAVAALAPGVPVGEPRALVDVVRDAQGPARVMTSLLTALALIAAGLGAVGLYASLAGWVARRRAEIGTRLALGAQPERLAAGVLATGLALTAAGILVGAIGGALTGRAIRSLLFGVSPIDPVAYLLAAAVLLAVAFVAAAGPAIRAAAVPPVEALKAT
jgi:putative ABC transport system permease protein